MFCRKCGSELTDDAVFCPKCGSPVDAEAPSSNKVNVHRDMTPSQRFISNLSGNTNTSSGSGGVSGSAKTFYGIVVLIGLNIFTALSFLMSLYSCKIYEFISYFDSDSVSYMDVLKFAFSKNKEASDFASISVIAGFVIFPAALISIICVTTAVKQILGDGIKYSKYDVLAKLKTAEIASCVQLAALFIFKFICFKGSVVSYSGLLYVLIIAAVSSLILNQITEGFAGEDNREDHNYKPNSYLSSNSNYKRNDSWVCNCGTRNPISKTYCKNCSKNRNDL